MTMPEGFDFQQWLGTPRPAPWTPRPVEPEIVVDVADDIVETDVMRKWRRLGFVEFETSDGGQLDVEANPEYSHGADPRTVLSIGTSDIGNASSVIMPVDQVIDLHRVLGEWLSHLLPAVSGAAGAISLDAAGGDTAAPGDHHTP